MSRSSASPRFDVLGLELGREGRHRHERRSPPWRAGRTAPVLRSDLGGERLAGGGGGLGELRDVAQALALRAQARPPCPARSPRSARPAAAARRAARRAPPRRCASSSRCRRGGRELSPGARVVGAQTKVLLADERVENVELERRPREAALLELARHGEQPLDERGEILARDGAAPGVGSGAPVARRPAGRRRVRPRPRAGARRSPRAPRPRGARPGGRSSAST